MKWKRITIGRGELGMYWTRDDQEIRPLLVANVPTEQLGFEFVQRGRAVSRQPFEDLRAAKAAAGERG